MNDRYEHDEEIIERQNEIIDKLKKNGFID